MYFKKLLSATFFYAAGFSAILTIIALSSLKRPVYGFVFWILFTILTWLSFLFYAFLRYLFRDIVVNFAKRVALKLKKE